MPYIDKDLKVIFEPELEQLGLILRGQGEKGPLDRAGEVTYVITELLLAAFPEEKYAVKALVDGILGTAAREYYRRSTAPYEDKKIEENGDVY